MILCINLFNLKTVLMNNSASSYIPFARKYRPANFSELLGQEVLTKTLSYCIESNRLVGAHLLTGIRGVGKTSSARIIAKTINCTDIIKNGDEIKPCEKCKNCESFNKHNHPDIIEIDAASRTGVDDIREIIESSEYKPLLGKYKVFIVDEVHMLSKSAFNALLKIIEEPPAHVVFLFATTEVHKIPLTVISRCQRYDLRRLTFEEIYELIANIASKEQIKFEEEALKIIAIKSEGSARDATTILDQAASYSHNNTTSIITADQVNKMLGSVQTSTIIKLVQLIISNSPAKALALLEEIYNNSSSLEHFIQSISEFIADLCKSKVITDYHNPLYQSYTTEITDIIIGMSLSRLTILWQIFSQGVQEIKTSHNELITAQMLVIKAIYSCNIPKIEDILDADAPPIPEIIDTTPIKTKAKVAVQDNTKLEITDFLKFCHQQSELEIYYLLLNEVEIKSFDNNKLEIITPKALTKIDKIKELLSLWSNKDWTILTSKNVKIKTLKEQMLEKAKISEDFQVIKNHFPSADISDIILKT
jgi:DNA polymerase III subunit gamma/tau